MKIVILISLILPIFAHAKSYQVGSTWDKKHIAKASSSVQILKESIGEIGSRATIFYIGEFNNKHLAVTNNHVCPNQSTSPQRVTNRCVNQSIYFSYYRNRRGKVLEGKVSNALLVLKSLDLSVLEISFTNLDQFERAPTALIFSDRAPYLNQELISIGYGVHNNEYGVLKIEEDSFDCQVFSRETRLVQDPDTLNPVGYKVNSFLHGCDVSHGDSGSPILDRNSFEVVGLLWTGKYPKSDSISQAGFENLPIEFLWKELNYASPGFQIKEKLEKLSF
jgi:hypothetical protein